MNQRELVNQLIATGKVDELIKIINDYSSKLFEQHKKNPNANPAVYTLAHSVLLSVMQELRELKPGQAVEDSVFLKVWREQLAHFGIGIDVLAEWMEKKKKQQ